MTESLPAGAPMPLRTEFAGLFDGVPAEVAQAVEQVLASHRLSGMTVTGDVVADLIGYATGTVSEAEYNRRADERAAQHGDGSGERRR